MSNKSIIMVQIRRILQLHLSGTSQRGISKALGLHRGTVSQYLGKLASSGTPLIGLLELDDNSLSGIVHSPVATQTDGRFGALEGMFPYIKQELGKTGVTRQLLWEEYTLLHPGGYGYAQFCEHLSRYQRKDKATMHLEHRPGEFLQIDFAGKQLSYVDRSTGEIINCPVLVCTLPFSNFTYVEALASAKQEELFGALCRCLGFLGGVPRNILSDNMKQYVKKNERYEFAFQEMALQWSAHYNTNLDATRPRRPKDKPSVENHVYVSYLRIYARLRKQQFYNIRELNLCILKYLEVLNQASFQKLGGSRCQKFLGQEKHLLGALPACAFVVKRTTQAKVQMNYHVILGEDRHWYSVPYQYIGGQTKIIYDWQNVEIFIGLERIAMHQRDLRKNFYTTLAGHMPEKHLRYKEALGWDADYFIRLAAQIGESSAEVFRQVLASKSFEEQSYKACMGLKALSEKYQCLRFEAACKRALQGTRINYGVIKRILENNLDQQEGQLSGLFRTQGHENIRGPLFYN